MFFGSETQHFRICLHKMSFTYLRGQKNKRRQNDQPSNFHSALYKKAPLHSYNVVQRRTFVRTNVLPEGEGLLPPRGPPREAPSAMRKMAKSTKIIAPIWMIFDQKWSYWPSPYFVFPAGPSVRLSVCPSVRRKNVHGKFTEILVKLVV